MRRVTQPAASWAALQVDWQTRLRQAALHLRSRLIEQLKLIKCRKMEQILRAELAQQAATAAAAVAAPLLQANPPVAAN